MGLNFLGRFCHSLTFAFMRHVLWAIRPPVYIDLLGGPGSGKGTLAKELVTKLSRNGRVRIRHISTGDLFRREIAAGTALGKAVEPILKSGGLVPDEITIAVLAEELSKFRNRFGAIIDGFPRTHAQALLLEDLFAGWGLKVTYCFFLDGTKEVLEIRLSGRRTCSNKECGCTYHVEFQKPIEEGICNVCKSPLYRREDDAPEVVGPRIAKFEVNNAPIVKHFERADCLHRIKITNDEEGRNSVADRALAIMSRPSNHRGHS